LPAYRFCRPDDIPQLVRALNDCWDVHFPGAPAMTVERFRREMKELDVWPSNSMLALGGPRGNEPIAVSIGTKRAHEVLVARVGVRPDHLRRAHGRHLVTSLGQKLAVLGPPRLVVEVALELPAAESFFTALGYRREAVLLDYRRQAGEIAGDLPPEELVVEVTAGELAAAGALTVAEGVAWERSRETLLQSGDRLRGEGLVSADRLEAWLLFLPAEEAGGEVRVLAWGAADPARRDLLLALLLRRLAARSGTPMVLPKLLPGELRAELLAGLGFVAGARHARFTADAQPL
jgi:ribosomal protein S18 acetylase RimI-like enzyme